jgi:hypothetical protein
MLVHLNHAWHACPARTSMTFPTRSLGLCSELLSQSSGESSPFGKLKIINFKLPTTASKPAVIVSIRTNGRD